MEKPVVLVDGTRHFFCALKRSSLGPKSPCHKHLKSYSPDAAFQIYIYATDYNMPQQRVHL